MRDPGCAGTGAGGERSQRVAFEHLRALLVAASIVFAGCGAAHAQFSADLCKSPHTTVMLVKLTSGFRLVFALTRDGDRIKGRVQGWQSSGVTAGQGSVAGTFGGHAPAGRGVVLNIYWEGRSAKAIRETYFKGYLHEGQGSGTALDLQNGAPVGATAKVLNGCPKWPEQSALAPTATGPLQAEQNLDRPGYDYRSFDLTVATPDACRAACVGDAQCKAYTYIKPGLQGSRARCWLKDGIPSARVSDCCVSGVIRTSSTSEMGVDRPGNDYRNLDLDGPTAEACRATCSGDPKCKSFTYVKPGVQGPRARCWLKDAVPAARLNECCVSGVVRPPPGGPARLSPGATGLPVTTRP